MHRIDTDMSVDTFRVFNDDIVGFFNSLPQSRIQQACKLMLDRYQAKHKPGDAISMSVDLTTQQKAFRVFRGKSYCKQVFLQDVPEFVRIAFEVFFLRVHGHCLSAKQRCHHWKSA